LRVKFEIAETPVVAILALARCIEGQQQRIDGSVSMCLFRRSSLAMDFGWCCG
jgi:hypothetical protein